MPILKINIPTERETDLIEAFCTVHNRPLQIENDDGILIPNPESKAAFVKRQIRLFVKNVYKTYKIKLDTESIEPNKAQYETESDDFTVTNGS